MLPRITYNASRRKLPWEIGVIFYIKKGKEIPGTGGGRWPVGKVEGGRDLMGLGELRFLKELLWKEFSSRSLCWILRQP